MKINNMKIAICCAGAGHVFRGVETWSTEMSSLLAENNIEHTFFKGAGKAEDPHEVVVGCLKRTSWLNKAIVRFFSKIGGWRIGLGSVIGVEQLSFLILLIPHLCKGKFDIIHTQEFPLSHWLERLRKLGIISAKTILAHGTNEDDSALVKFDYLQHLCEAVMLEKKQQSVFKETWTAIPNFVNTEKFAPVANDQKLQLREKYGLPLDKVILLTVAAIKRDHKRIDWLADELSVPIKNRKNVFWVIAGGVEKETAEVIDYVTGKLGANTKFFTDLPHSCMPELYACADIFVLGSLRETGCIALMEGMSTGLVPFVHEHPVLRYIAGDAGFIIDMREHGDLSHSLIAYLDKPDVWQTASGKARVHIMKTFSREVVFDQTLAYYKRVIWP